MASKTAKKFCMTLEQKQFRVELPSLL